MMHDKKNRVSTAVTVIVVAAIIANNFAIGYSQDGRINFMLSSFIIVLSAVLIIFCIKNYTKTSLKNFAQQMEKELDRNSGGGAR